MPNKLKSLLRKARHSQDVKPEQADQQHDRSSHHQQPSTSSGHSPVTAPSGKRASLVRGRDKEPPYSDPNNPLNQHTSNRRRNRKASSQSDHFKGGPVAIDHDELDAEELDDTVANDYRAYLTVLSSKQHTSDSRHSSLGEESKLTAGASGIPHSHDIADRSIDQDGISNDTTIRQANAGSVHQSFVTCSDNTASSSEDYGLRNPPQSVANDLHSDDIGKRLISDGEGGWIDLRNTEDVDKSTHWAPAVTHEVVKPVEHEIIEERIYREIHNHDVFHYIQPVYQLEVLPAQHFMHDANGDLVEISENQIPGFTGDNQRWAIALKEEAPVQRSTDFHTFTEPKIIKDIKYMTPEGFERRETTILHPPELEDLSNYKGAIMPVEFYHHKSEPVETKQKKAKEEYNYLTESEPLSLSELKDNLPSVSGTPQNTTENSFGHPVAPRNVHLTAA